MSIRPQTPPDGVLNELRRRADAIPPQRFIDPAQASRVARACADHPDWVRDVLGRTPGPALAYTAGLLGERQPALFGSEMELLDLALGLGHTNT